MRNGTTLECFMNLMKQIPPDELLEKRRVLAEILGVEDSTVRRWMTGSNIPVGMSMISLQYYLDFVGYRLDELVRTSNVFKDAGRMLAFRVITLESMAELISEEGHVDHIFSILRGTRGVSALREEKFREMVDAYQGELAEKLLTIPKLVTLERKPTSTSIQSLPLGEPLLTPAEPGTVSCPKSNGTRDERFKMLVLNLLDFTQLYTDSKVPETVRDQLRNVVGQQNIFDLKNALSRLCSSKAFSNQ